MKKIFNTLAVFLLIMGIMLPITGCHHHKPRRHSPPPARRHPVVIKHSAPPPARRHPVVIKHSAPPPQRRHIKPSRPAPKPAYRTTDGKSGKPNHNPKKHHHR